MKKALLTLTLMFVAVASWAAKAYSLPMTFQQPDGTEITVRQHGDENFHYYTTSDGVILAHVGAYFYIAEIDEEGNVKATSQLAHNAGQRGAQELQLIASQNRAAFFSEDAAPRKAARKRVPISTTMNPKYVPHKGSPKIVVILAEFQDTKFSINNPVEAFNEFFNAKEELTNYGNENHRNLGSVGFYFSSMSNKEFTPEFTVVGPVTVPNNMAYYGGSNSNATDEKADELVHHAVAEAKDLLDFTQYDYDGDGNVDLVYIVYAGYMQNMGGPNESIWAKASYTNGTVDGIRYRRFCMSSEKLHPSEGFSNRIASIGVTCHEFSHCLGLPDLYVPARSSSLYADNQEMEFWDLMDGGENINNGYRPAAYTAWEKEAMGWPVSIDTLSAEKTTADISKPTTSQGTAYRILNPQDESEYFMLENIKKSGWNSGAYVAKDTDGGVLVYHVKYPYSTVNMSDYPNERKNPGIAVVPADGLLQSVDLIGKVINGVERTQATYTESLKGDLFNDVNGLEINDGLNLPNFVWYKGSQAKPDDASRFNTNKSVSFKFEGSTITINYVDDVATGIQTLPTTESISRKGIYTLDGRYMGTDTKSLPKGIYIVNKKKVVF